MQYNGLKDDLNSLAKFVYIYETEIKKIDSGDAAAYYGLGVYSGISDINALRNERCFIGMKVQWQ